MKIIEIWHKGKLFIGYKFLVFFSMMLIILLLALVVLHLSQYLNLWNPAPKSPKVEKNEITSDSSDALSSEQISNIDLKEIYSNSLQLTFEHLKNEIKEQESYATVFISLSSFLVALVAIMTTFLTVKYHKAIATMRDDIEMNFKKDLVDLKDRCQMLENKIVQMGTNLRVLPERFREHADAVWSQVINIGIEDLGPMGKIVNEILGDTFKEAWKMEYLTTFLNSSTLKERLAAVDFLEEKGDLKALKVFREEEGRLRDPDRTLNHDEKDLLAYLNQAIGRMMI